MFSMDTTINSYATATNAVAGRWDALAPQLQTVAPADYDEFFATVPADTVIRFYGDLYRRMPNGGWQSLEDIEQGYDDEDAVLETIYHADLAGRVKDSGSGQPVQVLFLGKRALWV